MSWKQADWIVYYFTFQTKTTFLYFGCYDAEQSFDFAGNDIQAQTLEIILKMNDQANWFKIYRNKYSVKEQLF